MNLRQVKPPTLPSEQSSVQSSQVFHLPQVSTLSTTGQQLPPYSVDRNFIKDLEKNLGSNDASANLLGPQPPPTPGSKVASIPSLQPPPPSGRGPPAHGGARLRQSGAAVTLAEVIRRAVAIARARGRNAKSPELPWPCGVEASFTFDRCAL